MMVNKKLMLGMSALAASALLLTACGGTAAPATTSAGTETDGATSAPSSDTTLTVWIDANRAEAMKPVAAQFEQETGIKVDLVIREFSKLRDDLTAQVPTGEGPDISIGGHDWIGALARDGVIAPVELGDKAAEFETSAVNAVTLDGQTYGVPYAIENVAILRNTTLAPDPVPATWDEMIAAGKATGAEYPFLVGLDEVNGDSFHMYPFQTSFGNVVFAQAADGSYAEPPTLALGGEGGLEYAQWLYDQGVNGTGILKPGLGQDLSQAAFNEGKTPYLIDGPWAIDGATAAGIDVAVDVIPSAGGQEARPFVGVQAFLLSAKSKNAIAANEFLVNYLATEPVQYALYEVGARPPALTAAAEKAAADPNIKAFSEAGANGLPMPSFPEMGLVWEDWGKSAMNIVKGADPTTEWTKMVASIEAKIAG